MHLQFVNAFWLILLIASCESPQISSYTKGQQVDSLFAYFDRTDGPGVAIGVIKDGDYIYKKYFGQSSLENDAPINEETVFNVASLSKQFTATCIHLLAEEGELALTDNIRNYLPDFPEYSKPITIEHLIYHTSGIRDYTELLILSGVRLFNGYNNSDALKMIYRQRSLNFEPGDKLSYSNSNYALLKEIIEIVSGQTLPEFARRNIFEPLGMTSTQYLSKAAESGMSATRYRKKDGTYIPVPDNEFSIGDGGVFSNLDDFLLWDQNYYKNKIGSADLTAAIEKPKVNFQLFENVRTEYASGLMVMNYKGQNVIFHGGGDVGIQTGYFRFPDLDFSVISMANTNEYNFWNTSLSIADIYLDEFLEDEPQENIASGTETVTIKPNLNNEELKEYVGYYYSSEVDYYIEIVHDEGQLKMPDTNAPGFLPVYAIQKDSLKVGPGKAKFIRDEQGNIASFIFDLDGGRVTGLVYKKKQR